MKDSNEQISFDLGINPESDGSSTNSSRSSFQELLQKYNTTENDIDDYAAKNGGDYRAAYRHFRIPQELVDNLEYEDLTTSPMLDVAPSGPNVNIKERAGHLSTALERYKKASEMGSFIPSWGLPDNVTPGQQHVIDEGNREFMLAYGAGSLAEYGFDPNKIDALLREESHELQQRYIGSDRYNEKHYKKLQRRLGRQAGRRKK